MSKNKVSFYQKGSIEIVNGEGTHRFPYHTHESYLVGVIKSGEVRVFIGDREYLLMQGMTYIVPSKVGMSIMPVKPYSYLTICIKNGKLSGFEPYRQKQMVVQGVWEKIDSLCEQFTLLKLTEEEFIIRLCEILNLREAKIKSGSKASSDVIRVAEKYINEHINDKFILNDLAQAVHMSKYHLIRVFKREMGITPKQYDQQCKMRQIKTRILNQEAEADIAMDFSFSSQSHMGSIFRRYMGISPKDYLQDVKKSKQ